MHYSSLARINHAYSLLEKHIPITTLSVFQDTSRQQFISIGEDWIACMHEHSPNYIGVATAGTESRLAIWPLCQSADFL